MFARSGLTGKLVFQMLGDAGESSPPHFAQNRVLGWKIAEKSRLANFERLHDIVNARLFVPALAEKSNRRINDLLTKTCLLAFSEAGHFFFACPVAPRPGSVRLRSWTPSSRWRSPRKRITSNSLRSSHV